MPAKQKWRFLMLEAPVGAHFTPMYELLVGLLALDVWDTERPD